jgi:hypothetical protein
MIAGAFGNDDRFDLTGQTAEKRVRKMVGACVESGPIASVTFGNALFRVVILIGLQTLISLFLLIRLT